jgi:hypothetical protein
MLLGLAKTAIFHARAFCFRFIALRADGNHCRFLAPDLASRDSIVGQTDKGHKRLAGAHGLESHAARFESQAQLVDVSNTSPIV